jgi:anthranilate phosphoribosyltransferase
MTAPPRGSRDAPDAASLGGEHPLAAFVRTLGRGPGRSRALTREEARAALAMMLDGKADPHQVGATLMLMRYRGESIEETVGFAEAARAAIGAGPPEDASAIDLDWPSYGAGRTRGAPWFLLSALALAQAGHRIVMHGSNEFSRAIGVGAALVELGLRPARDRADALRLLGETGFAYLPLAALSPTLDRLLGLRELLGLRSPINTVARLLDPFDARAGIDGVFHPPYIDLHLGAAERLDRPRLLVVKGGGGEAERNPAKPLAAHLHVRGGGRREIALPPLVETKAAPVGDLAAVWRDAGEGEGAAAIVRATIALALIGMGASEDPAQADEHAVETWAARRPL